MANEHLIVEINEKFNFKKVTCKEGHYITDWNKENILDFTSSTTMYCPMDTDLSIYYCISEEEYNKLMEQQEIAFKTREEEERNKIEIL